jgi:hypothetical protein
VADARYLLIYGQLAAQHESWTFIPLRVVLSWGAQRRVAQQ